MFSVKVSSQTLRDFERLSKDTKAATVALNDNSRVMQQVKQYMVDRWATNFSSEGQIYGKWKGLAGWTLQDRAKKGYGSSPILVRTGALFSHFIRENEAGEVSNDAVYWQMKNKGSRGQPGGWTVRHHEGYDNPLPNRGRIPARVLWDINDEDEERIEEITEDYVDIIIRRYIDIGERRG
jgi:phage gpG-like protein